MANYLKNYLLTIICRIPPPPAPNTAVPPVRRKPGCQASDRRRACDRRRREAWAERRLHRSQSRLHTPSTAKDNFAMAEPATTGQAVPTANSLPSPTALPTSPQPASPPLPLCQSPQQAQLLPVLSPQPIPPLLAPSPQPAPPLQKRAKTVSEATRSSSQETTDPTARRMSFAAHITSTANLQSTGAFCTGNLAAIITFTAKFQSTGSGTLAAIGGGAAISLLRATV
jgi:hypothetical protein